MEISTDAEGKPERTPEAIAAPSRKRYKADVVALAVIRTQRFIATGRGDATAPAPCKDHRTWPSELRFR